MNIITDQGTKTLTSTKALVTLGALALAAGGGLMFVALRIVEPTNSPTGAIPITACRVITSSGNYILQQSFDALANNHCIVVQANNVTIDGNGKTVTMHNSSLDTEKYAVEITYFGSPSTGSHNITLKNLITNGGVRIYGDTVSQIKLDHLTAWRILNLGGDDVTISNNTVGAGGIQMNNGAELTWYPLRNQVRGNTVTGSADTPAILVELRSADGHPCPELDGVFYRNVITATDGHPAVRIKCATHTRFTENNIHTTGQSIGLFLRDESDDGYYENNTVITTTVSPALWLGEGNVIDTLPSRNTFRHNVFRGEAIKSFYALGAGSQNTFTDNVFYGNDPDLLGDIAGYHGNTFDHNTFYNAASGGKALVFRNNNPNVSGLSPDMFTNNIFSYSGNSMFGYDSWHRPQYSGDHNLFNNRGGTVSFGDPWYTLTNWKGSTSDDGYSTISNVTNLLINPTGGNYSLQTSSPDYYLLHNKASDGTDIGARL